MPDACTNFVNLFYFLQTLRSMEESEPTSTCNYSNVGHGSSETQTRLYVNDNEVHDVGTCYSALIVDVSLPSFFASCEVRSTKCSCDLRWGGTIPGGFRIGFSPDGSTSLVANHGSSFQGELRLRLSLPSSLWNDVPTDPGTEDAVAHERFGDRKS